ncbi:MAG TPA: hypothetical protein DDZ62_03325, partial [Delftia acidovorans]|nr:hypothetical protein [Delftia acidovorans]
SAHAIRRLAPALLRVGRGCLAQIEEPAAVAGPVLDVRAIAAAVCQRVAELPDRNSPEDWPEAMLVTGQELIDVVTCELEQAQAAPALEAPAHQCCNSWFASLPEGRQAVLRDDKWMLASAAYEAGREPCSALEAPAAARADLLVTVAMQVARGGNITSDIQTHDNSYADVATGLAEIKREIERVFREKYNCPHYPKSAQEAHIPIVRHAAAPQAPAAPWKDHQTARLVNDLRDCAIKYHGAGQLRERIAHIVVPLCDQLTGALAAPAAPAEGEVLVEVIGLTGSGKSAICGEIEILCRALGLDVSWPDGDPEKNMTHAEWTAAIEAYKPRVRIVERNVPRQSNGGPAK